MAGTEVGIQVSVLGVPEAVERLESLDEETNARLVLLVRGTALSIEGTEKKYAPVHHGLLRASIHTKFYDNGHTAVTGPHTPIYDIVMELGRRRGARMPPPHALYEWVERHFHVPKSDVPRLSFVVARSISRKGIAARGYVRKGWDTNAKGFKESVERIIADSVRRANGV